MNQLNKLIVPIAIIIAGGLIAFAIYITSTQPAKAPAGIGSVDTFKAEVAPVTAADHIRGNKNAKIVIIDYSDLECPFCKSFHASLSKIVTTYGKDVAWVYRHFPLDIHPKARKEAEASECAAELGGEEVFWKYIDHIYSVTPSNNRLEDAELLNTAKIVGLDQAKFKTCLDSGKFATKIEEQYQEGLKAGARGTPYTVVLAKGQTFPIVDAQGQGLGAIPYEALKSLVEQFLK
ncbi:MAG: hypothetical protein RL094_328 [Candidatus Parcubacteria bacterium]|jgi:protein-disulfide isomerase